MREMRAYATTVRRAALDWIETSDLDSTDVDRFAWVGATLQDALLFSLRHAEFHMGEWHAVLVQLRGREAGDAWIPDA